MDEGAFSFCTKLIQVEILEGITSISKGAFYGCSSLENIALPFVMEYIHSDAFSQCPIVNIIGCKNPVPPVFEVPANLDFDISKCTLFIPYASVSAYASAAVWKEFTHVIEIFGFELSYTELTIGYKASVQTIDITYDGAWTAVSNKDWLTVSPTSGTSSQTITITATNNVANTPRFATITFTTDKGSIQTVSVKQHESTNRIPVANAGEDQKVNAGVTVQLNGSASADPDHDVLTYQWTAPSGIILSSSTAANPTFIAPVTDKNTRYVFTLVVSDGMVNSPADQVVINVSKKTELIVSENSITIGAMENSQAFVKLRCKSLWTASSDKSWLKVSPLSGDNNQKLTFTAQANPMYGTRVATVIITAAGGSSETITVTQEARKHTKQGVIVPAEVITETTPVITCYPNPFMSYLTIQIVNPSLREVSVDIYSMTGQKIKTLLTAQKVAFINLTWDGINEKGQKLPNGMYIIKMNEISKHVVLGGR